MARKSKFEDEKNRLDRVSKYLEEAREDSEKLQFKAADEQLYERAEMLKSFKDALIRAIKLCGEPKPKEDKKENE